MTESEFAHASNEIAFQDSEFNYVMSLIVDAQQRFHLKPNR
jgi:hypothetical protein